MRRDKVIKDLKDLIGFKVEEIEKLNANGASIYFKKGRETFVINISELAPVDYEWNP